MEVNVAWSQLGPALAWRGGGNPRKISGNIVCVVSEIRTCQFAQRRRVCYGYTRLVTVTTETQWIKLTAVLRTQKKFSCDIF